MKADFFLTRVSSVIEIGSLQSEGFDIRSLKDVSILWRHSVQKPSLDETTDHERCTCTVNMISGDRNGEIEYVSQMSGNILMKRKW